VRSEVSQVVEEVVERFAHGAAAVVARLGVDADSADIGQDRERFGLAAPVPLGVDGVATQAGGQWDNAAGPKVPH